VIPSPALALSPHKYLFQLEGIRHSTLVFFFVLFFFLILILIFIGTLSFLYTPSISIFQFLSSLIAKPLTHTPSPSQVQGNHRLIKLYSFSAPASLPQHERFIYSLDFAIFLDLLLMAMAKPLDYELLNENVKKTAYAVRGELYLRASELQKEGKKVCFLFSLSYLPSFLISFFMY
jgi:hypothetical protein